MLPEWLRFTILSFHALPSVALLKLGIAQAGTAQVGAFTRSTERGLVEAIVSALRPLMFFFLPRSTERGLVEAKWTPRGPICFAGFPRSAERGLVEAESIDESLQLLIGAFHALPSVA